LSEPLRVGIVGSGDVTKLYLADRDRYPDYRFVACADLDPARAAALSAKGGFPSVTVDALIADPSIDLVLNLTPPTAHAAVSRSAIAAGKHVYSEKPLATSRADATAIITEAAAAGVHVGGAPDTFLGGGLQTARALIDEGAIGEPIAASATFLHLGPESWHPNPAFFYQRGGGPLLDIGPYYVTALVALLGPVASVEAIGRGVGSTRTVGAGPMAGQTVTSEVPTTSVATLTFQDGVVGSFTASFDVVATRMPEFEIHGTSGSLALGDPNWFDGMVALRTLDDASEAWTDVPLRFDPRAGRGIGLADLAQAIRDGRPARASGALAYHVLDVLLSIEEAVASGARRTIRSSVERPAPLPD